MPARNVGVNSTFEEQRQVINAIAEDVLGITSDYATEGYVQNLVAISTFSGDYNDLINTPQNLGDFTNDVGFITSFVDTNYWGKTLAGINTLSNVGIGTTNPQFDLDVFGDINLTGTLNQNGSPFVASRWTSGIGDDIYRVEGNIGIGTTNPIEKLQLIGDAILGEVRVTSTGIITSSNPGISTVVYYGDGSNLTGVTAFYVENQSSTSSPVYPTLASGAGVSTVGIATTGLVFEPNSNSLGIGITNPQYSLDVVGDINITGTYRIQGNTTPTISDITFLALALG